VSLQTGAVIVAPYQDPLPFADSQVRCTPFTDYGAEGGLGQCIQLDVAIQAIFQGLGMPNKTLLFSMAQVSDKKRGCTSCLTVSSAFLRETVVSHASPGNRTSHQPADGYAHE
jgi:hypothetical protein